MARSDLILAAMAQSPMAAIYRVSGGPLPKYRVSHCPLISASCTALDPWRGALAEDFKVFRPVFAINTAYKSTGKWSEGSYRFCVFLNVAI
ncbi:hypothetical protein AMTR_s00092p00117570 [Amborella trichopoda]|uniref:Uncharacterized protein n=1 Tax=Amborella trichopoda TaxID=13333 RepID=W1NV90_AMBTC|nr:hypothetical protein AMTR_s00092p00117570 [Amborella trichopoda]